VPRDAAQQENSVPAALLLQHGPRVSVQRYASAESVGKNANAVCLNPSRRDGDLHRLSCRPRSERPRQGSIEGEYVCGGPQFAGTLQLGLGATW
jgi:hypothetical protein